MGALRHLGQIDQVLAHFLREPLPVRAGPAELILRIATVELLFLEVAPHAAVSSAVVARRSRRSRAPLQGPGQRRRAPHRRRRQGRARRSGCGSANTPVWAWDCVDRGLRRGNRPRHRQGARRGAAARHHREGCPRCLGAKTRCPNPAHRNTAPRPRRPHRGSARLRRRRLVGAGRGSRHPRAPARRRERQDRHRPLRRARRQDGATGEFRCKGHRRRSRLRPHEARDGKPLAPEL